jgi:hypothetical protein
MRYLAIFSLLWLCAAGCKDEDAHVDRQKPDSGEADRSDASSGDAGQRADAATDAGSQSSQLRPALPRPPKQGLPAELRPPR